MGVWKTPNLLSPLSTLSILHASPPGSPGVMGRTLLSYDIFLCLNLDPSLSILCIINVHDRRYKRVVGLI